MRPPDRAEVVLFCRKLADCVDFFRDMGFRLDSIGPADAPRRARLFGHDLAICLEASAQDGGGHLRIPAAEHHEATAPNGTVLEFVAEPAHRGPTFQPATFVVRQGGDAEWHDGRAGMRYQDLIVGRQDGRLIASRIRVERAGPVADDVHYHEVDAQIIYCRTGWVRLVYEDQGDPFVLQAGDCVLQPPRIRHRVLESSAGLEVIEVSSPAEHETRLDHELTLPNERIAREREFDGQRFARHQGGRAVLKPWVAAGFDMRATGIATASGGAIGVRVVRVADPDTSAEVQHNDHRRFWFVLRGEGTLQRGAEVHRLTTDGACVLPPKETFRLGGCTPDFELLEVLHQTTVPPAP